MRTSSFAIILSLHLAPILAQPPAEWKDLSPHRVRFVEVEDGVRLETLDWGGTGRPLVLLTGSGNTAHVFDDFVRKLIPFAHVYGITRRGFGASSHPEAGYTDQRLANDVLRVLGSLNLLVPILAGHSMGGNELTTLGSQYPERVAGLIYLDAGADPKDFPANDPAYMALVSKLPPAKRLQPPPRFPDAECRESGLDPEDARRALKAIGEGTKERDYSKLRAPVLSVFATFRPTGDPLRYEMPKDPQERAAVEAFEVATTVYIRKYEKSLLTAVPAARIVELPGANHYIFISNEADVVREIRSFIAHLP